MGTLITALRVALLDLKGRTANPSKISIQRTSTQNPAIWTLNVETLSISPASERNPIPVRSVSILLLGRMEIPKQGNHSRGLNRIRGRIKAVRKARRVAKRASPGKSPILRAQNPEVMVAVRTNLRPINWLYPRA